MSNQDATRIKVLHGLLAPERQTRIVDVGASPINPAPYEMLLEEGLVEVIGFEPQVGPFTELKKSPVKNRLVLPYAVGDGKVAKLHVCKASGFSSLLEPSDDFVRYAGRWGKMMRVVDEVQVKTKCLDDISEIDEIDLLKIDIQGGELSVFQNGIEKLQNAVAVFTEVAFVPIYRNQPLIDEQMQFLRSHGFEVHKLISLTRIMINTKFSHNLKVRQNRNQMADGDVVFVKRLLNLCDLPAEKLKHLAILSDGVFNSFDLTLRVLETLMDKGHVKEADILDYEAHLSDAAP